MSIFHVCSRTRSSERKPVRTHGGASRIGGGVSYANCAVGRSRVEPAAIDREGVNDAVVAVQGLTRSSVDAPRLPETRSTPQATLEKPRQRGEALPGWRAEPHLDSVVFGAGEDDLVAHRERPDRAAVAAVRADAAVLVYNHVGLCVAQAEEPFSPSSSSWCGLWTASHVTVHGTDARAQRLKLGHHVGHGAGPAPNGGGELVDLRRHGEPRGRWNARHL